MLPSTPVLRAAAVLDVAAIARAARDLARGVSARSIAGARG